MPRLLLLLAATLLLAPLAAEETPPYIQFGPMLGHVSSTEARIWVKATQKAQLSIQLFGDEHLKEGKTFSGPLLEADSDFMNHAVATDLKPATRYRYTVLLNGAPMLAPPLPSFVTAPADGEKTRLRFALVSCLGPDGAMSAAAFGEMSARAKFDLLLMLGDQHYANSTVPEKQRAGYYKYRGLAGHAEVTRRTPTYAIWDDHDFGPNDSDGTADGKENSLIAYKQLWANPAYGEPDNPGCYYKFARGNIAFFMLDGRYHRTPNNAKDDGKKTMLGEKQLAWIKRELKASTATVKFVAIGSEWQSHGTTDSWTSFSRERLELFNFIEQNAIKGVFLLSGDRHFSGAYHVLNKWIEVTSGPLGSKNFPTKNLPEMFLNFGEGKMFSIIDVDTTGPQPVLALEVYRAGYGLVAVRPFTWQEVLGESAIPPLPPTPNPPLAEHPFITVKQAQVLITAFHKSNEAPQDKAFKAAWTVINDKYMLYENGLYFWGPWTLDPEKKSVRYASDSYVLDASIDTNDTGKRALTAIKITPIVRGTAEKK